MPSDARYDADGLAPSLMNVVEKIFAAAMVVTCVLLLARMLLRPRRRARVDASLRNSSELWSRRLRRLIAWPAAELRARRIASFVSRRAQPRSVRLKKASVRCQAWPAAPASKRGVESLLKPCCVPG